MQLPTAAPCKVKQEARGKAYLAALGNSRALPDRAPPSDVPETRANERTARLMLAADRTAMMQLAMALFDTAPPAQKAKVQGRLIGLSALSRPGAAEASWSWIEYEQAPIERKRHIDLAAAVQVAEAEL